MVGWLVQKWRVGRLRYRLTRACLNCKRTHLRGATESRCCSTNSMVAPSVCFIYSLKFHSCPYYIGLCRWRLWRVAGFGSSDASLSPPLQFPHMSVTGDTRSLHSTDDDPQSRALFTEEHVLPILIGAKVALLQPPRSLGVHIPADAPKRIVTSEGSSRPAKTPVTRLRHWWFVHGEHVLNQLCQEVCVN